MNKPLRDRLRRKWHYVPASPQLGPFFGINVQPGFITYWLSDGTHYVVTRQGRWYKGLPP